jgi:hypothetical protein
MRLDVAMACYFAVLLVCPAPSVSAQASKNGGMELDLDHEPNGRHQYSSPADLHYKIITVGVRG